jgi:hypothetical protein
MKGFVMFWIWLFSVNISLFKAVKTRLRLHMTSAFHALLFGGDMFVLLALGYILQQFPSQHASHWWLAGLAATLGALFMLATASVRIFGPRRFRDPLAEGASTIMLVLCFISVISAVIR